MLGGAFALFALAQSSPKQNMNTQTEDFRRQAPQPLAPRPLNIPTSSETTLPNGLRLVVVEDSRLPLVSYRLAMPVGTAYDPRDLPGLMSMMTGLLTEGTTTRTSKQIADEVARIGGTLTADTNSDYTVVAASALKPFSNEILDIMRDVVLNPSFPENELMLAKQNTKQGLVLQRSQPSFLATERISRVLFGEHPYGVVSATPASVDAMTRERLSQTHRSVFVPNNAVMVVVGDVKVDEVKRQIGEMFGTDDWKRGEAPKVNFAQLPKIEQSKIYLVDRPGSQQSNIVIGNLALDRSDPEYFPALLMHTILGANASSRLFMNLREEKGYTYGAYSNLDARRNAGSFRSTAEVRSDVTGASLKEFFNEMNRIRNEAVSDKELADAKAYLTGVFPIRLETQEGLINQLVQIKMFDLPANYLQTYRENVQRITKEDVQRAARKFITPEQVAIVVVGDANLISDQVKPYAKTIEIYDASGERKDASAAANNVKINLADVVGAWTVKLNLPGQQATATLNIKEENNVLNGSIVTPGFGETKLNGLQLNGDNLIGQLALNFQGQQLDGTFAGRIGAGNEMSGTITLSVSGAPPFPFTATRAQ